MNRAYCGGTLRVGGLAAAKQTSEVCDRGEHGGTYGACEVGERRRPGSVVSGQ